MNTPVLNKAFIRFLLIGVINTLVGTLIMFGLYNIAGCSYWISSATNYLVGSILSFFLNKYFTFQSRGKNLSQIIRFAINIIICYLLAYGMARPISLLLLANNSIMIRDNLSMLGGMCLFTGLNYLGQRFFVFKS